MYDAASSHTLTGFLYRMSLPKDFFLYLLCEGLVLLTLENMERNMFFV